MTATPARYIPVAHDDSIAETDYAWDLLDRQERRLARWGDRKAYINRYIEQFAEGTRDPEDLSWTPWESMNAAERQACERYLRPQASQEFWEEVLLVADAAGYCEVFDRIAHVMGGPVRSQNAQVEREYVTLSVTVHVAQGTDLNDLTRAVNTALAPINGLRFYSRITATREENPDVKALRARVEEIRAERAERAERARLATGELADWEDALIETAE